MGKAKMPRGEPSIWRKASASSYEPALAVWLGLVRQRCLTRSLRVLSDGMSKSERVKLLDAAMKSHNAAAFLDGVQAAFNHAERKDDALLAGVLSTLIQAGEIETVMRMRADWMGGGDAALSNPDLGL